MLFLSLYRNDKGEEQMSKLDKKTKELFIELYTNHGWTIKEIAGQFQIKERSVIAVVEKREPTNTCLFCGKEIEQTPGHRQKEFCSQSCYRKWRKIHALSSSARHICQWCGKEFIDPDHINAKYCCEECRNKAYKS